MSAKEDEKLAFDENGKQVVPSNDHRGTRRSPRLATKLRPAAAACLSTKQLGKTSRGTHPPAKKKKKKNSPNKSTAKKKTPEKSNLQHEYFKAEDWVIFKMAHKKVENLVFAEGPYRTKLVELAGYAIDNFEGTPESLGESDITAECVIEGAWSSVKYRWANPGTDACIFEDKSCAYTTMVEDENKAFPVIAIGASFKINDCPAKEWDESNALSTDQKKTLLLFFAKIKHEFLHVIHRYLAITSGRDFQMKCTPTKFTPSTQRNIKKPLPEVGDHGEEEDYGGTIHPRRFNQKLSATNAICVIYQAKYLSLNDEQVEGLLNDELYSVQVQDVPHDQGCFGAINSRAYKRNVLDLDFYRGSPEMRLAHHSTSEHLKSPSASRSSSGRTSPDDLSDSSCDGLPEIAAWRRYGHIIDRLPDNFSF